MTRKYSDDIRAEIAALVPDNNTGQITPAGIRQIFNDIVDSFTPAFGAIRRTASLPVNLTTVPTKLTVFDEVVATSPELVSSVANDTITAVRAGYYNFNFTASIAGSNNSDVVVELRRNGLQTFWRALSTTTGVANRAEITIVGIIQAQADNDEFSIYVNVLTGTDNADFYDVGFVMETIQSNA